jgi:hypothetical protein
LPKLSRRAAVEAPDAVNLTTEDERGEALGILEKDGVIQTDRDRTQVWIRIPVTAAAIREHAIPIRQEAVRELMVARRAST